jgi:hypothetical protein
VASRIIYANEVLDFIILFFFRRAEREVSDAENRLNRAYASAEVDEVRKY